MKNSGPYYLTKYSLSQKKNVNILQLLFELGFITFMKLLRFPGIIPWGIQKNLNISKSAYRDQYINHTHAEIIGTSHIEI